MDLPTPNDDVPHPDNDPNNLDDVEDEDEDEEAETEESEALAEKQRMDNLIRRLSSGKVPLRVHDIIIKGNTKTKEELIEAEIEGVGLRNASSFQELINACNIANARLRQLEIFDSVNITLNSGPPELPGTADVVVEVVETKSLVTGDFGVFTKPGARSWSLEGSLKLKNLFGYGDLWDGATVYGWDQMSEISFGVFLPRLKGLATPLTARLALLTQDWLKFSSYKERTLGLSLGLLQSRNHEVAYNLYWRNLTDPSQLASRSVRRQLGHSLSSVLKYTFKVDRRNSLMRPTQGYAFVSTSQIGGLLPDYRSLRFFRQEFDLRYAFPLGFYNFAFNFGIAGGVIFPWGRGFLRTASSLPDRFFLGGNSSPVCTLGGPLSVLGFKSRGLGPTESRREIRANDGGSDTSSEMDFLGGDLAFTTFADLSFDLPLRVLREAGIHGHAFACTGSLTTLTENAFQGFSFRKFLDSVRSSVGFGIILPTNFFRMEVNYCYILKQQTHDSGKTGVQFCFSAPS